MSRTFRKRPIKFWFDIEKDVGSSWRTWYINYYSKENNKWLQQERAKYYTRTKAYFFTKKSSFPKYYRKYVNNKRKAFDKAALKKELSIINYNAVYDPWNHKTCDPDWFD